MRKILSTVLIASLFLGGCGFVRNSALNPANWFGRSQSVPVQSAEVVNPLIPTRVGIFKRQREQRAEYQGQAFEEIIDLQVERVPGGAIIRATGRALRQGRYEVRLTPVVEDETPVDGVLSYRFEGVIPAELTNHGKPQTREHTAARRVTDQMLRGVRTIRVEGVQNARVVRR